MRRAVLTVGVEEAYLAGSEEGRPCGPQHGGGVEESGTGLEPEGGGRTSCSIPNLLFGTGSAFTLHKLLGVML